MQAGAGAGAAACVQPGQSAASHTVQGSRLRQGTYNIKHDVVTKHTLYLGKPLLWLCLKIFFYHIFVSISLFGKQAILISTLSNPKIFRKKSAAKECEKFKIAQLLQALFVKYASYVW